MSNIDKDTDLIERYYRDELSKEDKLELENKLETDNEFKENFIWYGNFVEVTKEEGNKQVKQMLVEIEENRGKKGEKDKFIDFRKKWLGMAATIIMFTGTALLLINSDSNSTKLFERYFEIYPNEIVQIERSAANNETTDLQQAMIHYMQGDHIKAIGEFNQIETVNQLKKIQFYKAISLLAQGEAEMSMALLKVLNLEKEFELEEAVDWYIALNYLKLNKEFEAREKLEELLASEQKFQRSAALKLLEKL